MTLNYDELRAAISDGQVGVRSRLDLEPLGGTNDKIFPPTYDSGSDLTRYAIEGKVERDDAGGTAWAERVVLDSVASQANRFELTLLDAIRTGAINAPVTAVDFAGAELFGLDRVSDYEAPHRIFDAILRDSFDGDYLFRHGSIGKSITDANSRNATAIFHHSPHTLLFGGWDSTGPKGGRGAKYERAITSEVMAHDVQLGVSTGSRIDPLGIELKATVYEAADELGWTANAADAVTRKGKPALYSGGSGDKPGRPSLLNHGNVTPSVNSQAGGITAKGIVGTTVLSFIQLRRLRFPTDPSGEPIPAKRRNDAEIAARTALAALGLAATTMAYEQGFDLRSRCVLVPNAALSFEMVGRSGATTSFDLGSTEAAKLVNEAADRAQELGIGWRTGEHTLRPADRLVDLVRRSQDVAGSQPVEEA